MTACWEIEFVHLSRMSGPPSVFLRCPVGLKRAPRSRLVVNATALFETRYMDRAVNRVRDRGKTVSEQDLARLSPSGARAHGDARQVLVRPP
jgi:hypothetical protein